MTIQTVSWVLDESEAEGRTRCVAIALANRFDAKQPTNCWPGMNLVAKEAKTSLRTAQRCVDELVFELQELIVVLNAGGNAETRGDRRPNLFIVPAMLDEAALTEVLAEFSRDSIIAGDRWAACLPPRATACQLDMPSDPHGVTESAARGDRNTTHGVPKTAPRHDTAVTRSDIDPSVDPTGTFASGSAERPKARPVDELWDSMLAACGLAGVSPTPSARGSWNKALKGLRSVGATPTEIERRARAYRAMWPNVTLTPTALEKHWDQVVVQADVVPIRTPLAPDHDLQVLARVAVDSLAPEIRETFGVELLMQGALACIEQNPTLDLPEIALAAEVYAEARTPFAEPAR